ncbi:DUF4249 family protein [Mucilaginibacter terrae]|uniref:DUF4249 domain-containing protein n=1 Tax=Mucilaginibacter terrae TaxID=1955052 RepID=A0ABU3GPA1_9SPHI|nr:DUF4249 family protein [Mucilaginibacter terrae]MDT3401604.1 hypothetical protein [Mucilaginibacter terrae]
MLKKTLNVIVILSVIFIIMLHAACKKESASGVESQPVIESYLIPGQPLKVKVYQQKGLTDTATYGTLISGLQLQISNGSQNVTLTESATGTYSHADENFLIAGKIYTLTFEYNGIKVSASTVMPAKPKSFTATKDSINVPYTNTVGGAGNPFTGEADSIAVTYKWSNPDSLYHVIIFKNDDKSPAKANLRSNRPVNFTLNVKQTDSYDAYYRIFDYIGVYRVILYAVNKEYSDVLTSNTNSSSQKLTNPPGNIVNGFGIFTAMQTDTLRLRITQY